jgi:hypothetical protein
VLIIFAAAVIVYLARKVDRLEDEKKELYDSSLELLKKYQDRDQEELRILRDERRRTGAHT